MIVCARAVCLVVFVCFACVFLFECYNVSTCSYCEVDYKVTYLQDNAYVSFSTNSKSVQWGDVMMIVTMYYRLTFESDNITALIFFYRFWN